MLISLPGQPAGKPSSSNPQPPPPRLADLSVQSAPSWGTASVQPSPCKSSSELGSSVGSSRDDAGTEAAGRWRLSSAGRAQPAEPRSATEARAAASRSAGPWLQAPVSVPCSKLLSQPHGPSSCPALQPPPGWARGSLPAPMASRVLGSPCIQEPQPHFSGEM